VNLIEKYSTQGTWKIKVQTTNTSDPVVKKFEVKEYVLPKFEVNIVPPTYISAEKNAHYSWRVCAKLIKRFINMEKILKYVSIYRYTFGRPVQGNASVKFFYRMASYRHKHITRTIPKPELQETKAVFKPF
jgi:hypothetical protein